MDCLVVQTWDSFLFSPQRLCADLSTELFSWIQMVIVAVKAGGFSAIVEVLDEIHMSLSMKVKG